MKIVKPAKAISHQRTVSGVVTSIVQKGAKLPSRTSKKAWLCMDCQADVGAAAVVAGSAHIKDGRLICDACWAGQSRSVRLRRMKKFGMVAGLLMTTSIAILLCGALKSRRPAHASDLARARSAFEDFLSNGNFVAAMGEYNRVGRIARASESSGAAASPLQNELNEQISGWLTSRFGVLSCDERATAIQLLNAYPDKTSSGVLRLRTIHIDSGHLHLEYIAGSIPKPNPDHFESSSGNSSQDNARCMLINVLNLLPNVASVELTWMSENDEESKTYRAERDQREKLIVESLDRPIEPALPSN